MFHLKAPPTFGGKLNNERYYSDVAQIIAVLKPASTLAVIADHLNRLGFATPRNLPFNRQRVMNFIKSTQSTNKE